MNNYVDLLVPLARRGPSKKYEPLQWAKDYCPSYITNDTVMKGGRYYYRFFFGSEKDCTLFALRWS